MSFARVCHTRVTVIGLVLLAMIGVVPPVHGAEEAGSLTPCLAMDAVGQPIYPTTMFLPSGKEMVVVFALGPDEKFEKLSSRWIAVDVGDAAPANTEMAENTLDVKGQRSGLLRYSQSVPLPVGKYRLEVRADGKDWKTVDLTVSDPPEGPVEHEPSAPLFELPPDKVFQYQLTSTPGPGVKVNIPFAKPGPDGVVRADLTQKIGQPDEHGIPIETSINGNVVSTGWLKNDATGLALTHVEREGKPVKLDEPVVFFKLPLSNGMEWPYKTGQKEGQGVARAWGPYPVEGPDGAKAGWVVVNKEHTIHGEPGSSSVLGQVTVERHFLPGYGMVREVRVTSMGNKLDSRQEIALSTDSAFVIKPNPQMKGRLGRMVFKFPEDAKAQTQVKVLKGTGEGEQVAGGYGNQSFELLPGTYSVSVAGKVMPGGEVKARHETFPQLGALRLNLGSDTQVKVLDADKKTQVYGGYGSADVGLPVGTYHVQIAGQTEEVKVEAGKVTEF